jgi:hypothetical protein
MHIGSSIAVLSILTPFKDAVAVCGMLANLTNEPPTLDFKSDIKYSHKEPSLCHLCPSIATYHIYTNESVRFFRGL